MNTTNLSSLLKNVKEIPALPDIAVNVMRMTRDPDVTAVGLTGVISHDPGLTGNILRLCNSAYYGLPRVISSLTQAILYLGFHTVRNLVLTCAISDLLGGDRSIYGHGSGGLWTSSDHWDLTQSLTASVAATTSSTRNPIPLYIGSLSDR